MPRGVADGRSGLAVRAACAARRSLARSAADVKLIRNQTKAAAPACTSLVSSLPALEVVDLDLSGPVVREDLGSLLEALAWCPRLEALKLNMWCTYERDSSKQDLFVQPFPAPALAALSSLAWLDLCFDYMDDYALAGVVGALVPLSALTGLCLGFPKRAVVPAALGQLKGLQVLELSEMRLCVLEAGCLNLPNLQSLAFSQCEFWDTEARMAVTNPLPDVSALQRLTRIEFTGREEVHSWDPQLVRLPELQCLVLSRKDPPSMHGHPPGLPRMPAHMGSLSVTLLHLDISGNEVNPFPLALTQLVALEHLVAHKNGFAELPAGITALSRLKELILGRVFVYDEDPLQLLEKRPLDVRALEDLSGFPALCKLSFDHCEVILCRSVLGAARHASLTSLCFCIAHPAPECAPAVLHLSQELWRLRRGSVLRAICEDFSGYLCGALRDAQGRAPCQVFMADLEVCRLEACGL